MRKSILFDIESGSLSDSEIAPFMPKFEAPSNYKDEAKIHAYIAEKQKEWKAGAALDPMTARVLAIGLLIDDSFVLISEPATEAIMLHEFWDSITDGFNDIHRLIGFNCNLFDLPFMVRRSWKLGVKVPEALREGRYWARQIVDLREVWQLNDRQAHGSLDTIAKHLGVGAKSGNGADFAKLWKEDRDKAVAYLKNDLQLTAAIAQKLGVI